MVGNLLVLTPLHCSLKGACLPTAKHVLCCVGLRDWIDQVLFEVYCATCSQATAAKFLEADSRRHHQEGQAQLQQQLFSIISDYGACSNCQAVTGSKEDEGVNFVDLPIYNLLFDGKEMHKLDYTDYQQGIGCLCIE